MALRSLSFLAVAPLCVHAARQAVLADTGAWAKQVAQGENLMEWKDAVERNFEQSTSFLESATEAGARVTWPDAWAKKLKPEAVAVGQGAFGKVFLADIACDGSKVAIKEMKSTQAEADEESETLKAFGVSPFFTAFYAQAKRQKLHYIMMEAAMGGTFEKAISSSADSSAKLQLWYDMVAGVAEMHAKGVVHRDLKPANVFVTSKCTTSTCRAKVGDLGLACLMQGQPRVATIPKCRGVAGTPLYIAPETYRLQTIHPKNDVWAMGLMLYEVMFNKLPAAIEQSRTMQALESNIKKFDITSDAAFQTRATGNVKTLLKNMLDKSMEARSTAAQALKDAASFNQVSSNLPVGSMPDCWTTGQQKDVAPHKGDVPQVNKPDKKPGHPMDMKHISAYDMDFFMLKNIKSSVQLNMIFSDGVVDQTSGKVIASAEKVEKLHGSGYFPKKLNSGDRILEIGGLPWKRARSEMHKVKEGMYGTDLSVKYAKAA